jgi:hypothetical protein
MNVLWNQMVPWIFLAALLGFMWWTVQICAADARRRGKSPVWVTLLIFIAFPLGLLLWLVFRPEPIEGSDKSFRLENYRVQ